MTADSHTLSIVVILVNFHSSEDTLACVKSILQEEEAPVHFVVIDNSCPSEHILETIKEHTPAVEILYNPENIGFGQANNIGIKWAQDQLEFDFLVLLNNDTLIGKNALSLLCATFSEENNIGIATGKIMYTDQPEEVWYGGAKINRKKGWPEISDYNTKATPEGANKEREVEFVSGCFMLFSKESLRDIGGFDRDFFMYCEDLELCLRVATTPYRMWYNPQSVIYHKVHGSSIHKGETPKNLDVRNPNVAFLFFHLKKNQYRAIKRHYRPLQLFPFLFYFWARYSYFVFKMIFAGKLSFIGTSFKTRWAIFKIILVETGRRIRHVKAAAKQKNSSS